MITILSKKTCKNIELFYRNKNKSNKSKEPYATNSSQKMIM